MEKRKYRLLLLLFLLLLGLFGALHIMDLRGEEPRRALVAWEMLHRNELMQPTIQGWPYYNKPPLFNWLIIAFFQLTDSFGNWVVRLPSVLSFVATAVLVFLWGKRFLSRETAILAALFTITTAHHFFFATVLSGEMDLFFALLVFAQAMFIFLFYEKRQWFLLYLCSYLLMSVGFLTKGLPAVAFQGLTLLGWAIAERKWRWLFSWQHVLAGVLGLIPVVTYFLYYDQLYGKGALYLVNLLEEASQKSASESRFSDIASHLLGFPFQFIVDMLPWCLLLFFLPLREMKNLFQENRLLRFALVFIVANIIVYWISPGTRQRYLYMFLPFCSLWFAAVFTARPRLKWMPYVWGVLFTLAIGRIVYNYTVMPYQQRTMGNIRLYQDIHEHTLALMDDGRLAASWGKPDTIFVNPSVGSYTLLQDTILTPLYLPYQIPFYLSRETGVLTAFDTLEQANRVYLTTDALPEGTPAEHIIDTVWNDARLTFFKSKPTIVHSTE